jgi:thymidylate kinase
MDTVKYAAPNLVLPPLLGVDSIVVEGVNGSGKTTLANQLSEKYGYTVLKEGLNMTPPNPMLSQEHNNEDYKRCHQEYLTRILKRRFIERGVSASYPAGRVYDRRGLSTLVHQGHVATPTQVEEIVEDCKDFLFLIVDVPPGVAVQRLLNRKDSRFANQPIPVLHRWLRESSRQYHAWGRFLAVNGVDVVVVTSFEWYSLK